MVAAVIGVIHLAAPFLHDDYQVPVYPVFCVALSATLGRWWLGEARRCADTQPAGEPAAGHDRHLIDVRTACGFRRWPTVVVAAAIDLVSLRAQSQLPSCDMAKCSRPVRCRPGHPIADPGYLFGGRATPVPRGLEMGPAIIPTVP